MAKARPPTEASPQLWKQPLGRLSKLTPETQKTLIDALLAGNYIETACTYAGITAASYFIWLVQGRKARALGWQNRYLDFLVATEKAQASAEVGAVALIRLAAKTEWTAAAWLLERKFPDRWGRRVPEIAVQTNVNVNVEDPRDKLTRLLSGAATRIEKEGDNSKALPGGS